MPITIDELRAAAAQSRVTKFADGITDARRRGVRTAFLCHSHKDTQLAEGLVALLAQHGWRLYVDWKDAEMPERPNRETAERIQARIVECNYFLFLATGNSTLGKLVTQTARRRSTTFLSCPPENRLRRMGVSTWICIAG
jgi:hypothetical protein